MMFFICLVFFPLAIPLQDSVSFGNSSSKPRKICQPVKSLYTLTAELSSCTISVLELNNWKIHEKISIDPVSRLFFINMRTSMMLWLRCWALFWNATTTFESTSAFFLSYLRGMWIGVEKRNATCATLNLWREAG